MTKRISNVDVEANAGSPSHMIGSSKQRCRPFRQVFNLIAGHKDKLPPKLHFMWTAILVFLWYMFAIVGTIASKRFMTRLPKPMTLAGGQLAVGAALDFVLLASFGFSHRLNTRIFWSAFPVGLTLTIGRFLTYFSYKTVAASLTHTVKASSPVFTVLLLFLFYGKCQPVDTLISLFPIIIGVVLSAVTEMEIKADGFLAAIMAGLISTIQSLYAKKALKDTSFHPMVFHMYSCLWAAIFLLPSSLLLEGNPKDLLYSMQTIGNNTGSPLWVVIASFFCYWGQNLSSILVLSQMHVLSHQVANVSRRFVLIVSTMIYFGNAITATKMVGILMALSGFFWFSFSKKKNVLPPVDHHKAVAQINSPKVLDITPGEPASIELIKLEAQ